jgi:putative transposase
MQKIKGKSVRKLLMEFQHLRKQCWGRHVWTRGFFAAISDNITDEIIMEYIRTQDLGKEDEDFKISP